jgi:Domain of unknown function (DUF4928)
MNLAFVLNALTERYPKFLHKRGLCVGLCVTQAALDHGLPLTRGSLLTKEQGQVAGLGRAAVQKILAEQGITQILAQEGGRTSRGSIGLMEVYVEVLNGLHDSYPDAILLPEIMAWWIARVRDHFASVGPRFTFDPAKSIRSNIESLLSQAQEIQQNAHGLGVIGAMLQHLIGAKLDLINPSTPLEHHGYSVADGPTDRVADFQVGTVAIHVTTRPTPALIQKIGNNINFGLKPLIITLGDGVAAAHYLLADTEWKHRVDVIDAIQFLVANVFERSLFGSSDNALSLQNIIQRYNVIIDRCETEPVLKIRLQ